MKIEYDPEARAMYIYIGGKIKHGFCKSTKELDDDINMDLDKDGKVIGIEFLAIDSFSVKVI